MEEGGGESFQKVPVAVSVLRTGSLSSCNTLSLTFFFFFLLLEEYKEEGRMRVSNLVARFRNSNEKRRLPRNYGFLPFN